MLMYNISVVFKKYRKTATAYAKPKTVAPKR